MKAGKMTDEQIVGILREAEKGEKKIADLCREKCISAPRCQDSCHLY
jgi:hypothetical protein